MSYFKYIPFGTYEFDSKISSVKDICKRSMFISEHHPYTDLYDRYEIKDNENIQTIAKKFYESPSYHWIIALINEIHNLQFDWPLNQMQLDNYVHDTYGEDYIKIKHWVNSSGIICGEIKEYTLGYVNPPNPGVEGNQEYTMITFEEYESMVNDKKRVIFILKPELLGDFVKQFSDSFDNRKI